MVFQDYLKNNTIGEKSTSNPKPKFVMGEKKRKAEEAGQTFTDTWTPPKQTEDYFPEPVSRETFNALNPDGGNSNTLYSLKKAQREGTRIRNKLKNVLAQSNGQAFSANVFDDIDDDTIEKNIPLADQSLKRNKGRNITKNISEKYPNYRDGMAMLYAADEKGNKMAAKAAKLAAYTLKKENSPESSTKVELKNEPKVEPKEQRSFWDFFDVNKLSEKDKKENWSYYTNNTLNNATKLSNNHSIVSGDKVVWSYPANKVVNETDNYSFWDFMRDRLIPLGVHKSYIRVGWKLGADVFLRGIKKYNVSADWLEHSLQKNPKDLVFDNNSDVAKAIKNDSDFLDELDSCIEAIENGNKELKASNTHSFKSGDLYYSIHNCKFFVDNIKYNDDGTKDITVHISDNYDYTQIWTAMEDKGVSLGTIANDAGTVSTWLDAINPYKVDIYFTIRR